MSYTTLLERAVAAHVAQYEQFGTLTAQDEAFRQSAIHTAKARNAGVSGPMLADTYRRAVSERGRTSGAPLYTSPTSVDYHARTGRFLMLPGRVTSPRPAEIQTLIRTVIDKAGARAVDLVLRRSANQPEALESLRAVVGGGALGARSSAQAHMRVHRALLALEERLLESADIDSEVVDRLRELTEFAAERLAKSG